MDLHRNGLGLPKTAAEHEERCRTNSTMNRPEVLKECARTAFNALCAGPEEDVLVIECDGDGGSCLICGLAGVEVEGTVLTSQNCFDQSANEITGLPYIASVRVIARLIALLKPIYSKIILIDFCGPSHFDLYSNKNTFAGLSLIEALAPGFKKAAAERLVALAKHHELTTIAVMGDMYSPETHSGASYNTARYTRFEKIDSSARFPNCKPLTLLRIQHVCTWYRTLLLTAGGRDFVRKAAEILGSFARDS